METLARRVKARIVELYRAKKLPQVALAKQMGVDPSAAHGYVNGDTRISLDVLEAASHVTGIPVTELVAPPGSMIRQLDPTEAQIFRALRSWPKSVTELLAMFLGFFADEPPADLQTRNVHELYRQQSPENRQLIYGALQMMRGGTLDPSLRESLMRQVEVERQAYLAARAKKPPKGRRDDDDG